MLSTLLGEKGRLSSPLQPRGLPLSFLQTCSRRCRWPRLPCDPRHLWVPVGLQVPCCSLPRLTHPRASPCGLSDALRLMGGAQPSTAAPSTWLLLARGARKATGGKRRQSGPRPVNMFIGSGSLGHHLFQPSGAGGGGGKILTVHKRSPPVVPIDPLSHSRISSFDNTRAAQELRSRIQSKRR